MATEDEKQHQPKPKPAIVLVHDAFHQPHHYEATLRPLRERGFTVAAPALPTTGARPGTAYQDDVAVLMHEALQPLLDQGRDVVLVAHGFGALPASQCVEGEAVAERADCGLAGGVCHYVNVCGLAYPHKGRSILGTESDFPLQPYHRDDADDGGGGGGGGLVHLLETARPVLYSDLAPDLVDRLWPTVVKTHSSDNIHSFPNFVDREVRCAKTYVLCEHDQALATEYQAYFVGVGEYDHVVRIPAGHWPFLNMPDKMVDIICQIAEGP